MQFFISPFAVFQSRRELIELNLYHLLIQSTHKGDSKKLIEHMAVWEKSDRQQPNRKTNGIWNYFYYHHCYRFVDFPFCVISVRDINKIHLRPGPLAENIYTRMK